MKIKINDEIFEVESKITKPSEEILNSTFSVFMVQDIGGGEPFSDLNVDYEFATKQFEFDSEIEKFLNKKSNKNPDLKKLANVIATGSKIEYADSAACEGFCGEILIHKNGLLEHVGFSTLRYGILLNEIKYINQYVGKKLNLNIEILEA